VSALRRWWLLGPVLAIWALACLRILVDPTPRLPLLFNWTPSLPYRIAWLTAGASAPLARGDYVLYRFDSAAAARYPGLAGQPFFKIVRGLPGDRVTVVDRDVFINGDFVGKAKPFAFDRRPLAPIEPVVIPPGHFFAQGTSDDSFDSRYASSGLVRLDRLIGKVRPIL
jgi:conjugal transfer pilin signal peptidase TrbI